MSATGFNAKEGEAKQKQLIPAGQHIAKCYSVIDLGTQQGTYQGAPTEKHEISISFEFPAHKAVYKEEKGEQVMAIHNTYTFGMSTKAHFRNMLDSWIGKPITEMTEERMQKMVGKAAMIQVVHNLSKRNQLTYDNIATKGQAVYPFAQGTPVPNYVPNKPIYFSLANPNWNVFDSLPQFTQEKIQKCKEWMQVISDFPRAGAPQQDMGGVTAGSEDEEDAF